MNYSRIYESLIRRGKERIPQGYVERHHIIPKCLGGSDDNENLVALTPEEHFLAHVLLVKIHPAQTGLILAVQKMCRGKQRKRNKMYGWLKRRFSEEMRRRQTGSGNSQFGSRWVNDGVRSFKIYSSETIPDGVELGKIKKPKVKATRRLEQKKETEQKILKALESHTSLSSAIRSLGLQTRGGNYRNFKIVAEKYDLMSKFTSDKIKTGS